MANANGWGGARPGAGRKPRRQKFPNEANVAESAIARQLIDMVEVLVRLAKGGEEIVEETYEVPLRAQMKRAARDVEPTEDDEARSQELVLTKRVVKRTLPDRGAAEYLVSRILGAPGLVADDGEGGDGEETGPTIHRFLAGEGDGPSKGQTPR
jgi:hypothetical protein